MKSLTFLTHPGRSLPRPAARSGDTGAGRRRSHRSARWRWSGPAPATEAPVTEAPAATEAAATKAPAATSDSAHRTGGHPVGVGPVRDVEIDQVIDTLNQEFWRITRA